LWAPRVGEILHSNVDNRRGSIEKPSFLEFGTKIKLQRFTACNPFDCIPLEGIVILLGSEHPPEMPIMKKLLFTILLISVFAPFVMSQPARDTELSKVQVQDQADRGDSGDLPLLSASEHMYRADVYMSNRQFPSAQAHYLKVIENYPEDPSIPKALFGMGRSNMWQRNYETAIEWFDKLIKDYVSTPDGQEGLAFKGACFVRIGKNLDAARTYEMYAAMFPEGKRIESAYLNIIDAYREAGEYATADDWVDKTVGKFPGKPSEMNALHARLRMYLYVKDWNGTVRTSQKLLELGRFSGSMAYENEVTYLKAYALEKLGTKDLAMRVYDSIPADPTSYYAGLATDRIEALGGPAAAREAEMRSRASGLANQFPIRFKAELLKQASRHGIDPRFLLAIMKQESSFRPNAKSPAAARGLLQLTYDTALLYADAAGTGTITANSLYSPAINIAIGTTYIKKLKEEFDGLYEPIAASYNGGEDNALRWLERSKPKERAIFTSEVGFAETKKYVFKVMGNYRVYMELYDENLVKK
jgi:soluble lytic murein transglycosylase-like protein/TolA-binding protein